MLVGIGDLVPTDGDRHALQSVLDPSGRLLGGLLAVRPQDDVQGGEWYRLIKGLARRSGQPDRGFRRGEEHRVPAPLGG